MEGKTELKYPSQLVEWPPGLFDVVEKYLPRCEHVTREGKLCGLGTKESPFLIEDEFCLNECQEELCLPWLNFVFSHFPSRVIFEFPNGELKESKIKKIVVKIEGTAEYTPEYRFGDLYALSSLDGGNTWKLDSKEGIGSSLSPLVVNKSSLSATELASAICETLHRTSNINNTLMVKLYLPDKAIWLPLIDPEKPYTGGYLRPSRILFPGFENSIFFARDWLVTSQEKYSNIIDILAAALEFPAVQSARIHPQPHILMEEE